MSMYKLKMLDNFIKNGIAMCSTTYEPQNFQLKKCLLIKNLSGYDFERNRHKYKCLSKSKLQEELRNQGYDYERLIYHHEMHKKFHKNIINTMKEMKIEVKVVNKNNFDDIIWADIIVTSGGDATFLSSAGKILNNKKPVIGFNSITATSEGHLCLPKKYSTDTKEAIEKLRAGYFKWLMRSRIRTILINKEKYHDGTNLHDSGKFQVHRSSLPVHFQKDEKILPYLALNEVDMAELFGKVSYLSLTIDYNEEIRIKSTGMCVCTGSSWWFRNIHTLKIKTVKALLGLLKNRTGVDNISLAEEVTRTYNNNLLIHPEEDKMGYILLDLITNHVSHPDSTGITRKGHASKLKVLCRCYDARLVIDGEVSFLFRYGDVATFRIHPEDALRTVILYD